MTYHRYVDDVLATFPDPERADRFLDHINRAHPNIRFTIEKERDRSISFLDILITRNEQSISTSVFRKACFTGQGLNYFSFCPTNFKLNSCTTLINRAYQICSSWTSIALEFDFLRNFFKTNNYPSYVFDRAVNRFLSNVYKPKIPVPDVPKLVRYLSLPYFGSRTKSFQKELKQIINKAVPFMDLRLVFSNPNKMQNLFKFKDNLPTLMHSGVVYEFTCPNCKLGSGTSYIGSTQRLLKVRISDHLLISHRTNTTVKKEPTAVSEHCNRYKHKSTKDNFKILKSAKTKGDLLISESLLIKKHHPSLNKDVSCLPLYIA